MLRRGLSRLEDAWDAARFAFKRRTGLLGTPMIAPYRGMATPDGLWIRGRVIEDQGVTTAPHSDSTLTNLWLTLKRYETDEVGGARLAWRAFGASGELVTDGEGYFDSVLPVHADPGSAPWAGVELRLLSAPGRTIRPLAAELRVRAASPNARFGVISDIDDTIVKTGATNFVKHWRTVVANSARSRTAFPGVSHLYRALAAGPAGPETNPIFYVSSSPWNLYDLFESFLALRAIPPGPMLLKDFGLTADKWLTGGHDAHKLAMISKIMAACPQLRFLLVGDSGQRDAAIYAEAARRHEGRVLAVHIRDVTDGILAVDASDGIAALRDMGVPVTHGETLREAAESAEAMGLIDSSAVASVAAAIADRKRSG
ncbi:App1 family protein [Jiella sonneratiae]|uniref:DUF2183 domain-containing protein n=1 Tax=Jiella sonneratiae TaxID=2816856 RepID=A0ABS3J9Z4_9HYPH|nr:phosphatase domain-containing protein [Jiella sonneratiae]MBO0906494.1 DUF2183 domain-containing protein [Jiella sonneratiae]